MFPIGSIFFINRLWNGVDFKKHPSIKLIFKNRLIDQQVINNIKRSTERKQVSLKLSPIKSSSINSFLIENKLKNTTENDTVNQKEDLSETIRALSLEIPKTFKKQEKH